MQITLLFNNLLNFKFYVILLSYALDGKFEFLYSVSDANSADVSVKNMQGGQYKEIFAKHVDAVCEGLYTEMMKDHMEALFSNLVKPIKWKTCPIPAGPNEFMNFFVEDNFLPPYIPGGEKWLFEVRINEGDECIGGYRIYTIIRNEKTLLQG